MPPLGCVSVPIARGDKSNLGRVLLEGFGPNHVDWRNLAAWECPSISAAARTERI
jgi:hypothetical protein